MLGKYGTPAKNTSTNNSISPNYVPGAPPYANTVNCGTLTEATTGTDCGPIAAYNLLYHFDGSKTPSLSTLESASNLNWNSSSGTGYGANWTTTLNKYQSNYTYSTAPYGPSTTDVYIDNAVTIGLSNVPTILDMQGYLPGYQTNGANNLSHYVTGREYSGYGSGSTSSESLGWYDESSENYNGHYIDYTVAQLDSYNNSGALEWIGTVY